MSLADNDERYISKIGGAIHAEHLHRYRLAAFLSVGRDVLDVDSGEGYGLNLLAAVAQSVGGGDISSKTIKNVQQTYSRANLRFIQGNCTELPYKSASFDMAIGFETIENHDQHDDMMREICRVLRPDGMLIISSLNRPVFHFTSSEPNPSYHGL
jgi:ubiquinone/menaquinone biosynthesis C-methylase UbiE